MSMIQKHTLRKHHRSILNNTGYCHRYTYHHSKTNGLSTISYVAELKMLVKKRYQYLLRKKNSQIKKVKINY